jgi:hypothetical protein
MESQDRVVGKDIERFESFCHELHSTWDAEPVGCHEIEYNAFPFAPCSTQKINQFCRRQANT